MDNAKKAAFVRKMGKKRLNLARGGFVKRKNFDLGGLTGTAGGAGGTGFGITPGTNGQQLNNAYNNSQLGLTNQNILTGQLIPQNANAVNAEANLSNQYAQQASGLGPNVAQTQLAQSTGQNVANQGALAAGQRGAGANVGLIEREAGQQGAATQQAAAGQAATLQAQQQIAAEQAQAQLAGNQIAQSQGSVTAENQEGQGEQGILEGANTAANNVQGQLANTNLQGQQGLIGGVLNGVGSITGLAKGGEVMANPHAHKKLEFVHKMTKLGLEHHDKMPMFADGGVPGSSPAQSSSWSDYFGAPAAKADVPPQQNQIIDPDKAKAAQDSMRNAFGYADGGITVPAVNVQMPQQNWAPVPVAQGGFSATPNAGAEALGNSLKGKPKQSNPVAMGNSSDATDAAITGSNNQMGAVAMPVSSDNSSFINPADTNATITQGDSAYQKVANGGMMHPMFQGPHKSAVANYLMNKGGKVPALVSAGEIYLNPEQVEMVIHHDKDPKEIGMKFKGKAKIKGDSKKNDTIPADLDAGGVVIDRDNMGTAEKRKLFVHKAIAKAKAGRR